MKIGFFLLVISWTACGQEFDVILRGGSVYDGLGKPAVRADVGIRKDTIAVVGDLSKATAKEVISVQGLAVAPGFINMLSWADGNLLKDGRSMSDIKQGVTLEVFGEGISPGPRKRPRRSKLWTTLGGYFDHLEKKGVSPNFASFVGATSVRTYVMGEVNREATKDELAQMKRLVRQAMQQGALGVGSSLIYAPATFATTNELIELCKVASQYKGMYISHLRSESDKILEALNELMVISREAGLPAEIYHFKINQARNWDKIENVLAKVDSARSAGLRVTANMYPYTASATGLKERIPTWAQEGTAVELRKRLVDPVIRKKILADMERGFPTRNSAPEQVVILGFKKDSLNSLYKGRRLHEVARLHGKSADETVLDLVIADKTSVPALYFLMSEENMRRMLKQSYVSIGSDGGSLATTEDFLNLGTHPRAYGTFARVLGKLTREEKLFSWEEAIRRMTSLPASNLGLTKRGQLTVGHFADVVVFDPGKIKDKATYEQPHQYAEGVNYVLVNGVVVIREGEHTGAKPGRCVRGPGWSNAKK